MSNLLAARSQMGMSLAFHIIFAAIDIALPLMMVIVEWRWIVTKDDTYLLLRIVCFGKLRSAPDFGFAKKFLGK